MQVVSPALAVHIKGLPRGKQPRVLLGFHGLGDEPLNRPAPSGNLGLLGVRHPLDLQAEGLAHHGKHHGLLFGYDGLIRVEACGHDHVAGQAGGQRTRKHLMNAAIRMGHALIPDEINLRLRVKVAQQVKKDHLPGAHQPRHVKHRNTGNPVIPKEHLAVLLGTAIIRLKLRVNHVKPGILQIRRILVKIHPRSDLDTGKPLEIIRIRLQGAQHRRGTNVLHILRNQGCIRGSANGHDNPVEAYGLPGTLRSFCQNVPTLAIPGGIRRRGADLDDPSGGMHIHPRLLKSPKQQVNYCGGFPRVGIHPAFLLLEGKKPQVCEVAHHVLWSHAIHSLSHKLRPVIVGGHNVGIGEIAPAISAGKHLLEHARSRLIQADLASEPGRFDSRKHAASSASHHRNGRHELILLHRAIIDKEHAGTAHVPHRSRSVHIGIGQ